MTDYDINIGNKPRTYRDRFLKTFQFYITKEMMDFHAKMLLGYDAERIARAHELYRHEVDTLILNVLRSHEMNLGRLMLDGAAPLIKALAIDRFREALFIFTDITNKEKNYWKIDRAKTEAAYALLLLAPLQIAQLPFIDDEDSAESGQEDESALRPW